MILGKDDGSDGSVRKSADRTCLLPIQQSNDFPPSSERDWSVRRHFPGGRGGVELGKSGGPHAAESGEGLALPKPWGLRGDLLRIEIYKVSVPYSRRGGSKPLR
jgi:hypothetical protein